MSTPDLTEWKRRNPYVLVNVASIGTRYGRYATLDDAERAIAQRGAEFVSASGTQVSFREPARI